MHITAENNFKRVDNLLKKCESPSSQIQILKKLSFQYSGNKEEAYFLKKIYTIAHKHNFQAEEKNAIVRLTRYYYNASKIDSTIYWSDKIEKLEINNKRHSDMYYSSVATACQYLIWDIDKEKGLDKALKLYNTAVSEENDIGIIVSSMTLGMAFKRLDQNDIAIKYYECSRQKILEQKTYDWKMMESVLLALVECNIRLFKIKEANNYLNQYINNTNISDRKNKKNGITDNFINVHYCHIYCLKAEISIVNKENSKYIKKNLDSAKFYLNKIDNSYASYKYYLNLVFYYSGIKDYSNALSNMDVLLRYGDSTELMMLKAELLDKVGNYKESNICYKKAVRMLREKANASVVKQVNRLSHIYNMNQENLDNVKRKKWQLLCLVCILCFSIIVIILFVIYIYYINKIKRNLKNEKLNLIESENRLSIEKCKAEESDRLKSNFLSNMSHEIRTPLNSIVGFSNLLAGDDICELSDDEKKDLSKLVINNTNLLLNLINDVLDISKFEAQNYKFNFDYCELNDCCITVIKSIKHRVADKVDLLFEPQNEHFILWTDKLRLEQVLINLLTNAAKFTKRGSIVLSYTVCDAENIIRFAVTDTGCGIPKDKRDIIFNRFEKLNPYVQGTGLGLSICKIISHQFRGDVFVDSEYNNGTRMIFTHSLFKEREDL